MANYDVFMDGACSFCRWTRAKVEPYDSRSRLRFLDYNDPAIAAEAPFSRAELDREMHVRTPEGAWLKGFEAWAGLLRVLPKLAWLGRLASVPPAMDRALHLRIHRAPPLQPSRSAGAL